MDNLKRIFRNEAEGGITLADMHDFFFRGGSTGDGPDLSEIT